MDEMMDHLPHLQTVADEDVAEIRRKEATYQGSWRRGGGVNAWHMARRKYDRLATMLAPLSKEELAEMRALGGVDGDNASAKTVYRMAELLKRAVEAEDVFAAMDADTSGADGTVLAEVRDLRRYLLLFEARLTAQEPTVRIADHVLVTVQAGPHGYVQPDIYDTVAAVCQMPRYVVQAVLRARTFEVSDEATAQKLSDTVCTDATAGEKRSCRVSYVDVSVILRQAALLSLAEDSNRHARQRCPAWCPPVVGSADTCSDCGCSRADHSN